MGRQQVRCCCHKLRSHRTHEAGETLDKKKVVKGQAVPGRYAPVQQPLLFSKYNKHMGGVDLHDNAMNNYRIGMRAKAWWWPLFTAGLESAMVNAWKLHCFVRRFQKQHIIHQLDFRIDVVSKLIVAEEEEVDSESEDAATGPRAAVKHVCLPTNPRKRQRCKVCKSQTVNECGKCKLPMHQKCFPRYSRHN